MKKLYTTLVAVFAIAQISYGQNVTLENNPPVLTFHNNSGGTDLKWWDFYVGGNIFHGRTVNDANTAAFDWLTVTRNSYLPTSVSFPNGNVGIGTNAPIGKLTVDDGNTGASPSEIFTLKTTYGLSGRKAITWRDGANVTGQIDTYYDGTHTNMSFGHLYNSAYQTGDIMTLLGNGNVGIGTTSPIAALNLVRGGTNPSTDYASMVIATTGAGNIYGPIIYLNGSSATNGRQWGIVSSGPLDAGATGTAGNFAIYDATSGGSRLVINGSGYVGIGTTTPKEALSVNGNIRSKEVKVETANWPDYVFKPKYSLPSLLEVKNYIEQNQRLPDMPSEQEVSKNGINLGEIVKLQTKKIEELTLYAIDQQKQVTNQNNQLAEQQSQIKGQQKEIDELKAQVANFIKQQ